MRRPPCTVLLLTAEATEIAQRLDPESYRCEPVSGFALGVQALARNAHAICLIDERQPGSPGGGGRDGLDLLRQARGEGARTPAILLAADPRGNARLEEALAAGFAGYLPRGEADGPGLERLLRSVEFTRERGEFLQALAPCLFIVAGRLDAHGTLVELEGSLLARARVDPARLLGRNVLTFYAPAAPAVRRALNGEPAPVEWSTYLDGGLRHLEGSLLPDPVRGGALFFLRDVTERRVLERQVLEVSDSEQRRLGQDLHDGLGQHLAGLAYLSEMLRHTLAGRGAPEAESAGQLTTLLHEAIAQTRQLARGLCPVDLEQGSFLQAMQRLAANVESLFGVRCEAREETDGDGHGGKSDAAELRLPAGGAQTATHLYRIAQEAINNAVRHGRARHVTILLGRGGPGGRDLAWLRVRDDGAGFDGRTVRAAAGGLGLHMMRYRATAIGGSFSIVPAEGGGTLVACTFPLASMPAHGYTSVRSL